MEADADRRLSVGGGGGEGSKQQDEGENDDRTDQLTHSISSSRSHDRGNNPAGNAPSAGCCGSGVTLAATLSEVWSVLPVSPAVALRRPPPHGASSTARARPSRVPARAPARSGC